MNSKNVLLLFVIVTFLASCYYDNREELYKDFPENCDVSAVTYNLDIQIIIDNNCLGCHSSIGGQQPNLSTIENLRNNETIILERINKPSQDPLIMPPTGALQNCDKKKINKWFEIGTPE